MSPFIVYFSSVSENTKRFVDKLGFPAARIPLRPKDPFLIVDRPFVLITPTYGGGVVKGAVPKQVIGFLNDKGNRRFIRGVITSGNTNFGDGFCIAGPIIANKCRVPELYRFELLGTNHDVDVVQRGLTDFFHRLDREEHQADKGHDSSALQAKTDSIAHTNDRMTIS